MPALRGIVLQNPGVFSKGSGREFLPWPLLHPPMRELRHRRFKQKLNRRSGCRHWRWTLDELDEPPQVLRGCGEQYFVPDAAQAAQSKPVEPQDALHMRKSHLD